MTIAESLTLSIASKDRPDVLEATLRKLHDFGLSACPLILCDDGSSPPLHPPALTLFPHHRVLRHEVPQGQATARNRIAEHCTTPYLLQLDDDSWPIEGSMEDLLSWAAGRNDWLAIALPFMEPARGRPFPHGIPRDHALAVQSFVGCSALIDVRRFRELGGYAPWIQAMGEEEDLSLRALARGWDILTIDRLRLFHGVSDVGRDLRRLTERSFRNYFLLWCLQAPWVVLPWRLLRLSLAAIRHRLVHGHPAALRGLYLGLRQLPSLWAARSPVSLRTYHQFRTRPHALAFFCRN